MQKYFSFISFLLVLCFSGSLVHAKQLRIMTYNLENLWDQDSENTPQVWKSFLNTLTAFQKTKTSEADNPQYKQYSREHSNYYDPRVFTAKVTNFLEVMEMAEYPDIVALQEIESAGGSTRVFDDSLIDGETLRQKLFKKGYQTILVGQQSPSQPVAVTTVFVSKIPLEAMESVPVQFGKISSSARQIQVAKLHSGAARHYGPLVFMNGHWKSQRDGGDRERKIIATAVQSRIDELKAADPLTQVLLMGDFNMPYWDPALKVLQADGDLSRLKKSKQGFYNLWFEKKVEDRWDASFSGLKSPLSHMLLDQHFFQVHSRLKYVPGSFKVLGQTGPASKKLLDVSGGPMRWQVHLLSWNYFYHLGIGYSDHLPLIADFSSDSRALKKKREAIKVSKKFSKPEEPQATTPEPCLPGEIIDYKDIDLRDLESFAGRCLKIEPEEPLALWAAVGGHSAVTLRSERGGHFRDLAVGMVNSWDPYPNIQDSRVSIDDLEAAIAEGWNYKKPHPRSNRCYVSKILRSGGGRLKKIIGRLGYTDGVFRIHALSREEPHLEILDLPPSVESLCDWDKKSQFRTKKRKKKEA